VDSREVSRGQGGQASLWPSLSIMLNSGELVELVRQLEKVLEEVNAVSVEIIGVLKWLDER